MSKKNIMNLADAYAAAVADTPQMPTPLERKLAVVKIEAARAALESALEQQAEPVACRFCHSKKGSWTWQCYKCGEIDDVQKPAPPQQQAEPVQEPTPWRDMIVVTLVREGINKHKARELADHFAAQPVQEPWGACVSGRVFVGRLPEHARKISEDEGAPIQWLYTTPPAAQPEQRKPLDEWVIDRLANDNGTVDLVTWWRQLARAIEAAHNIKEKP